jgi:hypothetical protein
MNPTGIRIAVPTLLALLLALSQGAGAQAQTVEPMYGGVIIDGYDFGADIGPKGTILFDVQANRISGSYNGLKMPPGQRAIFAWVHDTRHQRTEFLGAVGWLKRETGGKNKGRFSFPIPDKFKGGKFGDYEIVGFSAEATGTLNGTEVVTMPASPAGSMTLPQLKPAFYLFAKLPGARTELHYCGHGEDFFYAAAPEKQFCYD